MGAIGEVLDVVGEIGVRALADRVDDVGREVRRVSDGPVESLRELARAASLLHSEGLVCGAVAQECARVLADRLDAVARSAEETAVGMTDALDLVVSTDREVAADVGRR